MPLNKRTGATRKPGGQSKPGGGQITSGQTPGFQPGQDFWQFNPRDVAGVNPLLAQAGQGASGLGTVGQAQAGQAADYFQNVGGGSDYTAQAANRATGLADRPSAEYQRGLNALNSMGAVSRRQVTGANIESDPAFNAARKAYSNSISRRTNNAAALAGLGRSTSLQAAQGAGEAQYLLPTVQDALRREESGINRELNALGTQAQGFFGASGQRGADARTAISALQQAGGQRTQEQLAAAGGLGNLAQAERAQAQNAIQAQQAIGSQGRDIEQQQLDAPYNEQQRLYREALNTMYGPLGMIGSLVGAESTTSKK